MEGIACFNPGSGCQTGSLDPAHPGVLARRGLLDHGRLSVPGSGHPDAPRRVRLRRLLPKRVWAGVQSGSGAWSRTTLLDTGLSIASFGEDARANSTSPTSAGIRPSLRPGPAAPHRDEGGQRDGNRDAARTAWPAGRRAASSMSPASWSRSRLPGGNLVARRMERRLRRHRRLRRPDGRRPVGDGDVQSPPGVPVQRAELLGERGQRERNDHRAAARNHGRDGHGGLRGRAWQRNAAAAADADFSPGRAGPLTGTLTFRPGSRPGRSPSPSSTTRSIEGSETILLSLHNPQRRAPPGCPPTAVLTIVDNDRAGTVQFSQATATAQEFASSVTLMVTRTGRPAPPPASVDYAITGDTAAWNGGHSPGRDGELRAPARAGVPLVIKLAERPDVGRQLHAHGHPRHPVAGRPRPRDAQARHGDADRRRRHGPVRAADLHGRREPADPPPSRSRERAGRPGPPRCTSPRGRRRATAPRRRQARDPARRARTTGGSSTDR